VEKGNAGADPVFIAGGINYYGWPSYVEKKLSSQPDQGQHYDYQ